MAEPAGKPTPGPAAMRPENCKSVGSDLCPSRLREGAGLGKLPEGKRSLGNLIWCRYHPPPPQPGGWRRIKRGRPESCPRHWGSLPAPSARPPLPVPLPKEINCLLYKPSYSVMSCLVLNRLIADFFFVLFFF